MMIFLVERETELGIGAGVLVIAMGIYLLINRKHLKPLAHVHPTKLALWSFLAAAAHGAGLMLVPIYPWICTLLAPVSVTPSRHATVHTFSTMFPGALIDVFVYFWFGSKFISQSCFNLDAAWAVSLILVGSFGVYSAYAGYHWFRCLPKQS